MYELELTDTFGDGWTGNFAGTIFHELSVTVGNTSTSYTMLNGFDTIIPINVCDNDTLIFVFTANGQWANECGVILRDPNGAVVYQNTAPLTTGQIFNGTASCNNPCPAPLASFSNTANFLMVDFDATTSTGTGLSYNWDFGDGTTDTGSAPIHNYVNDGQYTVTLIVTDLCNQTDTMVTTITVCGPLVASYVWSQNGLSLTVDASALTNATSFNWQWGDGATDTGSIATHTYATTGTFQVRLVVTNLCGQTDDTIIFIPLCVKPVASWTYNIISSGANGMTVQFDATASFGATTYFWDFGDGTTNNTSAIPVHTYNTPGLFWVVTLIVNNDCGDDDTLKASLAQINIEENLLGSITMYPNPTSNQFTIEIPVILQPEMLGIRVVDKRGSLLYEGATEGETQHRIDMTSWPAGTYIVEIRGRNGIIRKQLVVTK
jgi:PKD repeat protein